MILQKLLFLSMLFCAHTFYACSESKSGEEAKQEIVPFDLTPRTSLEKGLKVNLSVNPYPGIPNFKYEPRADGAGVFSAYNQIDETSSLYRNRERAVEEFFATHPDDASKARYYSGAICQEMGPVRSEYFGRSVYCFIHHCYGHECLLLYAYQAYLLQPDNVRREDGSINQIVRDEGKKEELRRMTPKSESNIFNKLRKRQLGMK